MRHHTRTKTATLAPLGALLALGLAAGACDSSAKSTSIEQPEAPKVMEKPDPELFRELEEQPEKQVVGAGEGQGVGTKLDEPGRLAPRGRRRVNIDQLDGMIQEVTGFAWTRNGSNQFRALERTLGKPDLVGQLEEDLSPTILFQKFLADAARSSCDQLAAAELKGEAPEGARLFVTAAPEDTWESAPEAIEENMQALLMRFHGQDVAPGSPEMKPWTGLFERALGDATYNGERKEEERTTAAWRLVCVAMISHPDFYLH